MFISRREYNGFKKRIEDLEKRLKATQHLANEKIEELISENADYRRVIRTIHRLIKKERGVQNYGSVENALNKLEREIDKIEVGE